MDSRQTYKKTKILATLDPSSSTSEIITELFLHGMNAVRLNFSHGTHEDHLKNITIIRALEKERNVPIAIVQDLQGPKIRVGTLSSPIIIHRGEEVRLQYGENQDGKGIPVQENIFPFLKPGDPIFINDGIIRLNVVTSNKDFAICHVVEGGEIRTHKGINIPETQLPNMSLTEKDEKDLAFGLKNGVDYIAISFVQKAKDIIAVKKMLDNARNKPRIIAKIETKAAVNELEDIIHESDAVMVARGDLAVELGQEEVPIIQREIIALARKHNTPVIIATQMLESMITNPEPTRAEVNDVATGVLDEVDAVMLSGETAAGKHPVKAVSMMNKIIKHTEKYLRAKTNNYVLPQLEHTDDFTSAIDAAAAVIVNQLQAKIVFAQTATGKTAFRLAAYRPKATLIAVSDSKIVCRQLALTWGIKAFYLEKITDTHSLTYIHLIRDILHKHEIENNARIVLITGKHPGKAGHTNTIHVSQAKDFYTEEMI